MQAWGEWFDRLTTSRTREGVILPTLETKKDPMRDHFSFAGLGGIEPTLAVLETAVLPLNDKPKLFNF